PWCMTCQQLSPSIEQICAEREVILVGNVNVGEDLELARRYRVMSIPTLVLVKDGKVAGKAVGFRNREEILNLLQ
ncbi:MAG: thioredoxin family protein, partial [Firmicutes bacterium]|nr:thioredoxin family protein [Bacillota bacterium]